MSADKIYDPGKKLPKYIGKTIINAKTDGDSLVLEFPTGKLTFFDDGQSCCEERYLSLDGDDPKDLIGHIFTGIVVKNFTDSDNTDYDGCHEIAFVEVKCDRCSITISSHNVHNGYYGGFFLRII